MQQKVKISPGQAILKTYSETPVDKISEESKKFYLNGPRRSNPGKNRQLVDRHIDQKTQDSFSISYESTVIHNDASRRYFESKLCYETFNSSLDRLERSSSQAFPKQSKLSVYTVKCESYLNKMLGLLKPTTRLMLDVLFAGKADSVPFIDIGRCKLEFNYLFKAKSWLHTAGFSAEKTKCLEILIKLALVATVVVEEKDTNLSCDRDKLAIYKNRGRKEKKENHTTRSGHLGLMRSGDPLPYHNDPLVIHNESEEAKFLRSVDESNYGEDAEWVKKNFSQLLHPFSQSLSGTTLAQLRVLKYLENMHKQQIFAKDEFLLFFKLFISVLHYFHGGHSLNEFVSVFQLPEVRENFTHIEGFNNIKMSTFFYDNNEKVFDRALEDSIQFNDVVLAKKAVSQEICERSREKQEKRQESELSPNLKAVEEKLSCTQKKHREKTYFKVKGQQEKFETEKNKLIEVIKAYRENAQWFSKHGLLGCIAAESLLNGILENTQKIKNAEAKLFVMRAQLESFVASGKGHFLMPESGTDQYSLRGRIITSFFHNSSSSITQTMAKKKRQQNASIFTPEGEEYLREARKKFKIPESGIPYAFSNKVAESSFSIKLDPNLYAHFRLKVKDGVPCDVFNKHLEDGVYQFVILKNNEFRFLPAETKDVSKDHHQSFRKYRCHHQIAGGENVYSAGNFEIKDQKIVWIDGGSGHYGTEAMRFVNYAKTVLGAMGLDTQNIKEIEKLPNLKVELRRFYNQANLFIKGFFSTDGEKILGKPKSEGVWDNKIPRF